MDWDSVRWWQDRGYRVLLLSRKDDEAIQEPAAWMYVDDGQPQGAVVDCTNALPACEQCGAEAFFQASPEGHLRVRWHCEHAAWADEDDARELAEVIRMHPEDRAVYASGIAVREDLVRGCCAPAFTVVEDDRMPRGVITIAPAEGEDDG